MHYLSKQEIFVKLKTSQSGLSKAEVGNRLIKYGLNELKEYKEGKIKIFFRQFINPLIFVLLIAGILAYFLGNWKDTVVIYGIVLINGLIGFYEEIKARASIESLKSLLQPKARVLRDGKIEEVYVSQLVPGDLIFLEEGDIIPADARLIESTDLIVDESLLTGESIPVEKNAEIILPESTPIYKRFNCVFKGTTVARGKGKAVIYATGINTQIGAISERLKEKAPKSPLTKAFSTFIKKWLLVLIGVIFLIGMIGIFVYARSWKEMIFFGVALLVSAVPEGLPLVVTIALVIGSLRLAKKKVLVRHLPAVETLGSATFICSDKTGTITEGRLEVKKYYALDLDKLYMCATLANESDGIHGDMLDRALINWLRGQNFPLEKIRQNFKTVWEHPLDIRKRLMAVIVKNGKYLEFYVKGAFESLIKMCTEEKFQLREEHDKLASQGLRVLAFGYAKLNTIPKSVDEVKIEIVGLIGFLDPPKPGVKEAIISAQKAGIKVIMITGDNLLTAKAVAKMVNLLQKDELAIEGKDIQNWSDEELYKKLKKVSVVARALPEDKYRIIKVLQGYGEIVAVTGDGVNDTPALRVADLGVAMGSGAQITRDAAAMVITDNNLSIIVEAIMTGRLIAKNIGKVIRYLLSTNFFEVIYTGLSILSGLPLPLYPTQILWINLVTDGVQDKAYPFTKYEGNPLEEKPKKPAEVFIGKIQFLKIFYNGSICALTHYLLFRYLLSIYSYQTVLTISFCSAVISQWAIGIQEISETPFFKSPWKYIKFNPYIYLGIIIGIFLQILALTIFKNFFYATSLNIEQIVFIFIPPAIIFLAIEVRKIIGRLKTSKN